LAAVLRGRINRDKIGTSDPGLKTENSLMKRSLLLVLSLLLLLSTVRANNQQDNAHAATFQAIQTPILKWKFGGCYSSSWCDTGSYASPAVADMDGDGSQEVIGAGDTLVSLNGQDGSLRWKAPLAVHSAWADVVVADIDGNGSLDIAVTTADGYLFRFDRAGNKIWSLQPGANVVRGLSAYDLDNDGSLELIVTGATYANYKRNTWVYEHDGSLRAGWPQLTNDSGYAAGAWNDNATVGDMDGDGVAEIYVPSDVHYICAYDSNGAQLQASPIYGDLGWGKVGTWENFANELINYGSCSPSDGRAERHRTDFLHSPGVIADVNGDGTFELVVTGNVYDCAVPPPNNKYTGVYIFNADRSRFNADGYDWRSVPLDTGAPLSQAEVVTNMTMPNPVVADLDGDGKQEILFPSYDGRLHAFWLDKQEHHNWPYQVYKSAEGSYRYASEPVVADLDNNGTAEVIFGSWVHTYSNLAGKLHILDYQGNPLYEIDLPEAIYQVDLNGARAAPTLANIDDDADLEVVLNTASAGLVAYDLPGTSNARILWGTGRGNYQRTGSPPPGTLRASRKTVKPSFPGPGDELTYTITLNNTGPDLPGVYVTDTLPVDVDFLGDLWAPSGIYGEENGVITWTGAVFTGSPVTIIFSARVKDEITEPTLIRNVAIIDDGLGDVFEREAASVVNGYPDYLPIILRR
jgi:uncharacterized repeat protein (TIGR01451 family)